MSGLPIAIIWLPNAILLAVLSLAGANVVGVLLAAIPTHLYLVTNFQPGVPQTMLVRSSATSSGRHRRTRRTPFRRRARSIVRL
jgi:hypothetical protein